MNLHIDMYIYIYVDLHGYIYIHIYILYLYTHIYIYIYIYYIYTHVVHTRRGELLYQGPQAASMWASVLLEVDTLILQI